MQSRNSNRINNLQNEISRLQAELTEAKRSAAADRGEAALQHVRDQGSLGAEIVRANAAESRFVSLTTAHDQLLKDAAFTTGVLEASNDCIKVLDLDGRLLFMSTGGQRVMEVDDFSILAGCPWPDFWHGASKTDVESAIVRAREGQSSQFFGPANTAKGSPRWWDVTVAPIFGDDGAPARILSISRDITARKEAEDHKEMLAKELQHRVQNLIAIVDAIAQQSVKDAASLSDAGAKISNRLAALSKAHRLLTRGDSVGATLIDVVAAAIEPYDQGRARFEASGADELIGRSAALAFTLALNELSTNATKYGALSNAAGRVAIEWRIADDNFILTWTESGGPAVTAPQRAGFGSRIIQSMFQHELRGGKAAIAYEPDGVRCVFAVPVQALRN